MKKKRVLIITLAIIAAFTTGVFAKNAFDVIKAEIRTDFVIEIDGEAKEFKNAQGERVYPILHDGTTYLPLRAIGEIMDKTVYWYEDDKRIELRAKPSSTVTDADVIILEEKRKENKKDNKNDYISVGEAKKIALEKADFTAKDVKFEKAELEEDDGVWYYEIEFKTGGVEHEFEIGAVNGAVLSWEIDKDDKDDKNEKPIKDFEKIPEEKPEEKPNQELIPVEKAKEIALEKAGLKETEVKFEKAELEEDDGIWKYEIEFEKGENEYEAEINAKTGEIIKWEVDIDD